MRNRVIYMLLFIFSFAIMHDTLLPKLHIVSDMQIHSQPVVSDVHTSIDTKKIYDIHQYFHFVALIDRKSSLCALEPNGCVFLHTTPPHPTPFMARISKPPIV